MRGFALLAVLALLAWGCDSGPKGPGEFVGSIETPGPVLGGAVLEVVGKGIDGFSGSGGSRVFWAARTGMEDSYRVIVIQPAPTGHLQFRVAVQDLGGVRPQASLVNLVGGDNLSVPATSEYRVRFRR
jgi:hypothetical protein